MYYLLVEQVVRGETSSREKGKRTLVDGLAIVGLLLVDVLQEGLQVIQILLKMSNSLGNR